MEEPVCLIENTTSGELQVNQEALDILSSIRQPVVVVSIVGMYRTGKSYLMNRLAGKRSGFSLGSTIQSETKGIWMWCVPHPRKNDHTLVLLDTEGLGDVEKGDSKNDTWIFALAVLLSSTLVYNSMRTIDSNSKQIAARNDASECIQKFFPKRKCFVMPRPVSQNDLRILDQLYDADLDPGFIQQATEFCDYIFDHSEKKTVSEGTPERIMKEYDGKCSENTALSFCSALLQRLWDSLDHASYMRSGGYTLYRFQLELMTFTYRGTPGKGSEAEQVLEVFLKEKEGQIKEIRMTDRVLTLQEHLLMEDKVRLKTERYQAEKEAAQRSQEAMVKRLEEQQKAHKERQRQIMEGTERERRAAQQEQERIFAEGSVEMQKPVCLIDSESTGKLQVNQEALDILSSIRQPVVVVSIVGMYRTGKSYLMNRLAGKNTGFALGSTIQSETKGIWMWCVPHPYKKNHTLVLLDTEGLGDVEKGDQAHDTWIFALAVLLSSTFVYNSMGTINNEAVMSHSKQAVYSNAPRECIRNYFPSRKCFVFDQPASKDKLRIMEQLTDADLEPSFVKQTAEFCSYIFSHSNAKTITGGFTATGHMLGNLAAAYVEAIRNGSVPCLENAVLALSQIENSTAVEQSLALYRQLLGERVKLHTETQEELSR
ncbi:hypothetical protein JZ751_012451, partial [Albula glossodonta]